MRIDHSLPHSVDKSRETKLSGYESAQTRPPGEAAISADQIELSSLSRQIREQTPGSAEREEKIRQLEALVEAGRYRVDAEQVGRAMIEDALAADPLEGQEGAG
jgi:flagellar biosynthesis anti-sigma factor FlgM